MTESRTSGPRSADDGPPDRAAHILVIDDSPTDLQYIVRVLRDNGYVPHAATDPRIALESALREAPDLVLLDAHLPGMEGYEVCQQLKAHPRTRGVPVIFVSGETRMLDRVRAFKEGAVDYITKPFQDAEALARVATHLSLCRLRARLVEEKERAEQASLAKSQFLANMSHELRTPLNAILGYAQILAMSDTLDARQARGVQAIHEGGEHLLRLINDILDLARIEAGKLQLFCAPTSIPSILRFVSHVIQVRAEQKGLLFACEQERALPKTVIADEKRLNQVLLNLLGNAVKFTQHGSVRLRVQARPDGPDAARLCFAVEDTGPGIASSDLDTIFAPFEQVGPARQRASGAGLGLAISRRLVQLMGGDIQVESELGVGSRFWFELKLPLGHDETTPLTDDYRTIAGYQGPPLSVLIVDDVAANREVAAGVLEIAGFRIIESVHGADALDKVRAHAPDIVLTDILMPVMDGLDLMRELRRIPRFAAVPIIAMSASNYAADHQRSRAMGADAFLPKPLDFNQLFDEIGRLLSLTWTRGRSPRRAT